MQGLFRLNVPGIPGVSTLVVAVALVLALVSTGLHVCEKALKALTTSFSLTHALEQADLIYAGTPVQVIPIAVSVADIVGPLVPCGSWTPSGRVDQGSEGVSVLPPPPAPGCVSNLSLGPSAIPDVPGGPAICQVSKGLVVGPSAASVVLTEISNWIISGMGVLLLTLPSILVRFLNGSGNTMESDVYCGYVTTVSHSEIAQSAPLSFGADTPSAFTASISGTGLLSVLTQLHGELGETLVSNPPSMCPAAVVMVFASSILETSLRSNAYGRFPLAPTTSQIRVLVLFVGSCPLGLGQSPFTWVKVQPTAADVPGLSTYEGTGPREGSDPVVIVSTPSFPVLDIGEALPLAIRLVL